jgi:hypothetical protein
MCRLRVSPHPEEKIVGAHLRLLTLHCFVGSKENLLHIRKELFVWSPTDIKLQSCEEGVTVIVWFNINPI